MRSKLLAESDQLCLVLTSLMRSGAGMHDHGFLTGAVDVAHQARQPLGILALRRSAVC